jgi:hypothetical protein
MNFEELKQEMRKSTGARQAEVFKAIVDQLEEQDFRSIAMEEVHVREIAKLVVYFSYMRWGMAILAIIEIAHIFLV